MKNALLYVLMLLTASASAQSVLPLPNDRPNRPATLKLGLTSLLGPDATVSAGVELPVGTHQAWQVETGYGWFNSPFNFDRSRYDHTSVWQARTEFRWYGFGDLPAGAVSRSLGPYFAVELAGKQINVRDQATVGRNCVSNVCTYFEKINQPVTRYTVSGFAKSGWQLPMYGRDHTVRFVTDLYVGIGLGYGWTTRAALTPNGSPGTDVYYTDPDFLQPKDRFAADFNHGSLDFVAGAKLGYRLRASDKPKK